MTLLSFLRKSFELSPREKEVSRENESKMKCFKIFEIAERTEKIGKLGTFYQMKRGKAQQMTEIKLQLRWFCKGLNRE
jgi:hypothetical protein